MISLLKKKKAAFNRSVFINCPFGPTYKPLFDAIVFTTIACAFVPRCAREESNAGESRIDKIFRIMEQSQFSVHNISRTELDSVNNLPRFNMPFELGIFLGAIYFGGPRDKTRQCIIFDSENYRYQKFLSDISGKDITGHGNNPEAVIRELRHWYSTIVKDHLVGPDELIRSYKLFEMEKHNILDRFRLKVDDLNFIDLCNVITEWLRQYRGK